jgi:hypothetical protein
MYLDGVAVATENDPDLCCNTQTPAVTSAEFRINRARDLVRFFIGTLDEVVLYPTTLTAQDVADQYAALVEPPPEPVLDSFLCYKVKTTKGSAPFAPGAVTLVDDFESRSTSIVKPVALCNPASQDGGGIEDEETHLAAFQIKSLEKHEKRTGVLVQNVLGSLLLDTVKEERLLVPSAKSLEGPATPPEAPPVDHFKCYKAKVSKGAAKFPKGVQVTLSDQFDPKQRSFDVKKPTKLCLPVDKNGEGIQRPDELLVCYSAKPAKGQRKHAKRESVSVANQFGVGTLDTLKEDVLCVPSAVALPE